MTNVVRIKKTIYVSQTDIESGAVDFTPQFRDGEATLSSGAVVEVGTSDLTISGVAVNTTALTIDGRAVAVGYAIRWSMSGFVSGTDYDLHVTAIFDSGRKKTYGVTIKTK